MQNAVYGKTIENLGNRIDVRFVRNNKICQAIYLTMV